MLQCHICSLSKKLNHFFLCGENLLKNTKSIFFGNLFVGFWGLRGLFDNRFCETIPGFILKFKIRKKYSSLEKKNKKKIDKK